MNETGRALSRLSRLLMIRDAVASVSLSHPESCRCKTCRAALGDQRAFMDIATEMLDASQGDDR